MCQRGRRVVQTQFQETQHRRKNIGRWWRKRWIISEILQTRWGGTILAQSSRWRWIQAKSGRRDQASSQERPFLPPAHASNLYVFYILRPSPSDIMNISFDKMKAFTMHSLRFYLLDWASSSVWDSYMWSGDSADSWQLCTSAHCSLLAEVKLKDRMIKRCRGLVSSGGAKAKSGCGCVWQVALSHCALHLPLGSPSLDQAETFHFSFF